MKTASNLCAECGECYEKHRFFDDACRAIEYRGSDSVLSGFHLSTDRFRSAKK